MNETLAKNLINMEAMNQTVKNNALGLKVLNSTMGKRRHCTEFLECSPNIFFHS